MRWRCSSGEVGLQPIVEPDREIIASKYGLAGTIIVGLFFAGTLSCSLAVAEGSSDCPTEKAEWNVQWENDSFPGASRSGSDRFYTNGIRVSRWTNGKGPKHLDKILERLWFKGQNSSSSPYCDRRGFRFGHQFYTPQSIVEETLSDFDRPYAGFVYGSVAVSKPSSPDDDGSALVRRSAELQVGLVGPGAGARSIQSEWHRVPAVDAPTPLGWHHQLPNEPVVNLNLSAARRIPLPLTSLLDIVPRFELSLGTVHTGAKLGAVLRFGNSLEDFPYRRIEPAIFSAKASQHSKERKFKWWFFVGMEGEAVAHDIFLDGTVFSSSHSVDKKTFRSFRTMGVHLQYKNKAVDLSWVEHSREFETQALGIDRHEYLSIGFSWGLGG